MNKRLEDLSSFLLFLPPSNLPPKDNQRKCIDMEKENKTLIKGETIYFPHTHFGSR